MWWRVALLAGLVGLALLAWSAGLAEHLDPASIGHLLRESGAWGPLFFVGAFAVGNGLGAPGALFILPAIAVWPASQAFLLIWAGCVGAGTVGYAFARTIGGRWVESRLPKRLRDLDTRAAERPVRTVAVVRLTFFLLAPAHWALGLSSVRARDCVVGSILGFLPGAALWGLGGSAFLDAVRERAATSWLALLVAVVVAAVLLRWFLRHRKARSISSGAPRPGDTPAGDPDAQHRPGA